MRGERARHVQTQPGGECRQHAATARFSERAGRTFRHLPPSFIQFGLRCDV
jgi:hypothetical protein